MDETNIRLIPITENELCELLKNGFFVDVAFGTGGVALRWDITTKMPDAIKQLGLMRGVLNKNMGGDGI